MKSYTDIEQSKKLAEILPMESADMSYRIVAYNPNDTHEYQPYCFSGTLESDIPCWSLAALLNLIPYATLSKQYNGKWNCTAYPKEETVTNCENAIDAAFELVVLLKDEETKMEE